MSTKRIIAAVVATLTAVVGVASLVVISNGETPVGVSDSEVCAGLDSGKIDTTGDPASVTVTAPDGFLINQYCVKAGSSNQGDGPVYVDVDPAQKSVVISYPGGKAVSHYSVGYERICEKCTTTTMKSTTTTSTTSTTSTTIPDDGTTTTTHVDPTTTVPDPTTTTTVAATTTTRPRATTTTITPRVTVPPTL